MERCDLIWVHLRSTPYGMATFKIFWMLPVINNQSRWDSENNTRHSFNCQVPEMHVANHIDQTNNYNCKHSEWRDKVSNKDGGSYEDTKCWKTKITVKLFGDYLVCFPTCIENKLGGSGFLSICFGPNPILEHCFLKRIKSTQKREDTNCKMKRNKWK